MRRKYNLKHFKTMPGRLSAFFAAMVVFFGMVVPVILPHYVSAAAQLQQRSLKISSSANGTVTTNISGVAANPGDGGNGQKTKETFTFNIATSASIGSLLIEYCDDPIKDDPCLTGGSMATSPINGFDASHVGSIISQTGWAGGAWSLDTTTDLTGSPWTCVNGAVGSLGRGNCIAINRGSPGAETATTTVTLAFGGTGTDYITNPTADNTPFFARVYTFSNTAYTQANMVDYGTVVGSTAQQIDITSKVKEVLNFSVSAAATTAPGTTCTPLDGSANPDSLGAGGIKLGDTNGVLSFTQAYDAHSYFRLSTNTNFGVSVYYSGDTLKNGTNQINAIGTSATSSTVNSSQFGLGLDSSDTQGGNGYTLSLLAPQAPYNQGNGTITTGGTAKFAFDTTSIGTPVAIATASGPVACETGSVRYLGNISTAVPAGIYTTTITYIATGTY